MLEQFVDKLLYLGKIIEHKVGERVFLNKTPHEVIPNKPMSLGINSLEGLAAYVGKNIDKYKAEELMIHIISHKKVVLTTKLSDVYKSREVLLSADTDLFSDDFNFGQKYDQEGFVINVMTKFVSSKPQAELLRIASSLKSGKAKEVDDDGMTQQVVVKDGAMVKKENIKNPMALAPYRTFREIEQPTSLFVFRVHNGYRDDDEPSMSLNEADGSAWKLKAIQGIREYFEKNESTKNIHLVY